MCICLCREKGNETEEKRRGGGHIWDKEAMQKPCGN